MHSFFAEDAITHSGHTIVSAITEYEKENGSAPGLLSDLIPEYLDAIPSIPEVDRIEYDSNQDQDVWVLRLYSSTFREPREFLYRSDFTLTEEEEARSMGSVHGFPVLSAE